MRLLRAHMAPCQTCFLRPGAVPRCCWRSWQNSAFDRELVSSVASFPDQASPGEQQPRIKQRCSALRWPPISMRTASASQICTGESVQLPGPKEEPLIADMQARRQ